MRPFWTILRRPFGAGERKHSRALGGAALFPAGQARWTARSYERLSEEGYQKNVVVYRAVRMIAESAAAVPWLLFDGTREYDRHKLLDLLRRPNPLQGGCELFEAVFGYLLLSGNAFLELAEAVDGTPGELYALRPDRMSIVPGARGWPDAYVYAAGGRSTRFALDAQGASPILHMKTFHPRDDYAGLSPLEAAACAVDLHNAAGAWNKALLDNAARPSGALVFEPGDGREANLSADQFDRLKEQMADLYQGRANAGRPLLLEGGLKWQKMSLSPADMDFINSKHVSARDIALAFGVPPMLLGIPGDNSYANYQEANRALWRQTILPLLDKTAHALNNWLAPRFGPDLRLVHDRDQIDQLSADREALWARVQAAGFLTVNEKRAAVGYAPIRDGDRLA